MFSDDAFDYPLAHSYSLFQQAKDQVVETIGIAHKAINIAIEKDDSYILKFLKEYIVQNKYSLIKNTTGESFLGQETNIFEEHSES
ncbi:34828_t:CDS:2, partial [Racocetra persica]